MNFIKSIYSLLLVGAVLASCNVELEGFEGASVSIGEFVKVHLTAEGAIQPGHLALVISDGNEPISTWPSDHSEFIGKEIYHSGLSFSESKENNDNAVFETTRYYNPLSLKDAKYCLCVGGESHISVDEELVSCIWQMPSIFTQTSDQSCPEKYKFMYSSTEYNCDDTSLNLKQISATICYVIRNTGKVPLTLQSVTCQASEAPLSASSAKVDFDCTTGIATLAYHTDFYNEVTVEIEGGNVTLAPGAEYTVYALVLPLNNTENLKNNSANIIVKASNKEYITSASCDWRSGGIYTIKIDVGEDARVSGKISENNRIELIAEPSGTYVLKYENADCQPLSDYAEICTLTVDRIALYDDFIDLNIAPRNAENIGVYDTAGKRLGCIDISSLKAVHSEPLYRFGLLSDLHCQNNDGAGSLQDLQRALTFFNENNVTMTCVCGDVTQEGTAEELEQYQQAITTYSPTVPVYTTTGNHDCTSWGQINENQWEEYIGLPLVFERTVSLSNGSQDHFLFLGMSYWEYLTMPYLDPHLAWLERKLEEYRNERCYIITHLFFPERAGNMNYIYPTSNWISGDQLDRLLAMCDNYVNTIWFSGHSHWKWYLQKYQDRANIYRAYESAERPASGWCVHVPSCANPSDSDGVSTRETRPYESEGAIVEVYEDHVDILGLNLKNRKYLPVASYRLETTLHEVAQKEDDTADNYLSAKDFAYYKGGESNVSVNDVEGMPGYVEITFTGVSQGYYVTGNSFVAGTSSKVSITVEDLQVFSSGTPIATPEKVGFYSGEYYLTSTNSAYVNSTSGVQFQTSSSCPGPWPLTIRLKATLSFY